MRILKLCILLLFCVTPALAQTTDCPTLVDAALTAVDELCQSTERNQACFGSLRLDATAQPGVSDFHFEQIGDRVSVGDIQSLRLYPMNESANEWGVVMMRLQANLPDTLPGQNVTFLLFGDVEITSSVTADSGYTPMQAFYLTTGVGDAACSEAPESGLIVQTPEGVGEVAFNVNGVDVSMGSTVMFQAQRGGEMRVQTLEGAASLNVNGEAHPVLAGTRVRLPLNADLLPDGPPELPEAYDEAQVRPLPLRVLQRQIEIHVPLTEGELGELHGRIERGEPLCDDDPDTFMPTCDHLPLNLGGAPCTFRPEEHPDRPPCDLPLEGTPEVIGNIIDGNRPCIRPNAPGCADNPTPPPGTPGQDDRSCVMMPGPNDPPLPETETRPFCETPPPGTAPLPGIGTPPPAALPTLTPP
ncbi:MAG: hypothetical protein U0694_04425 [Anaerolineae bacterium]